MLEALGRLEVQTRLLHVLILPEAKKPQDYNGLGATVMFTDVTITRLRIVGLWMFEECLKGEVKSQ